MLLSGLGEVSRTDLDVILAPYRADSRVYTCGPDRCMAGVLDAAARAGYPEEAQHKDHFSGPELPDYVYHPFTLKLVRSGRTLTVPANRSATDVS